MPPSYESADAGEIAGLLHLFEVDEDQSGALCGCLCGASFEFFNGDRLVETTHLVCNDMLRWSGWPSDALLAPANATVLLDWLAARGVTGPRDEEREDKTRKEAFQRKSVRVTAGWSARLRESFERDGDAVLHEPGASNSSFFSSVLASEFPLAGDRIRLLLRILGEDRDSWTSSDWQEVLADQLLRTYERAELERECRDSALRGGSAAPPRCRSLLG